MHVKLSVLQVLDTVAHSTEGGTNSRDSPRPQRWRLAHFCLLRHKHLCKFTSLPKNLGFWGFLGPVIRQLTAYVRSDGMRSIQDVFC